MPRNTGTTQEAKTFVSKQDYAKIVEAAGAEGVGVAEYIRRALRDRLSAQNVDDISLDVRHGGSNKLDKEASPMQPSENSGVLCIDTANTPEHTPTVTTLGDER